MSSAGPLFDIARDLQRDGIARATRHASSVWLDAADRIVRALAHRGQPFTSDDAWAQLAALGYQEPQEPRALGGVLKRLAARGVIRKTGGWMESRRPQNHGRPVAVWVAG